MPQEGDSEAGSLEKAIPVLTTTPAASATATKSTFTGTATTAMKTTTARTKPSASTQHEQ